MYLQRTLGNRAVQRLLRPRAGSVGARVQRYEAGEHARMGETQAELKAAFAPGSYTVQKGDTPESLAARFGLTADEIKAANRSKVKKVAAPGGKGKTVEGFDAGETISVPQKLNELAALATKDKSAKVTVNGVVLDYGTAIAMADLFATPDDLAKASPKEITDLAALIERERTTGKLVTTEEWQKATGGRYLKLAEKNVPHFAPQNAAFITPSTAGAAAPNHKSEWEKHHKAALDASQAGDKDKALLLNAFGDHFLTDAFSAGHLVNKPDVLEKFKSQLQLDSRGKEFVPASKAFFDGIATAAFTGDVKTQFSQYETAEPYAAGWRPNIDSVSTFSALLQGIHKEEPDLLANAVARGFHDRLNTLPGGLPVENAKGDAWNLSGDTTLNAKTLEVARKAVAQSQLNVIAAYKLTGPFDLAGLYQKVWDYTPRPSAAGAKQLADLVQKGTETGSADLRKSIVDLIQANYMLIIDELVKRKKLRKA